MKLTRLDAYNLMHQGATVLSQIESNGMRIDLSRLDENILHVQRRIDKMMAALEKDDLAKTWKKRYGNTTNFESRKQLGTILFEELGLEGVKTERDKDEEESDQWSTSKDRLVEIDHPFVRRFLKLASLRKLEGTYLKGVRREVTNGFLHPFFNLNLVRTYRSSSSSPNFQNIPIRNPEVAEYIRSCFIPRDGHQLVEIDFSGLEVRIAACYNKDPNLIAYIKDPTKDMHRDMAIKCYKLPEEEISKPIRYCAKNMFVFPEFYGSYYPQCAMPLWKAVEIMKLTTTSGVSLREHLTRVGFLELGKCEVGSNDDPRPGTFEAHIKKVEREFWEKDFPIYDKWKKDWYRAYLEAGGFDLLTGFRIEGKYKRNDVINYPVQGTAFHCLLWCLIQLQKWVLRKDLKTKIIGQIHDSIVADVHCSELNRFIKVAMRILTQDIMDHWDWLIVPLEVEVEVAKPGRSWFEKEKISC